MYMELNVEVTKVHRVLRFNQRPWLRDYIDVNANARKQASNAFEKNFFKLMNNAVLVRVLGLLGNNLCYGCCDECFIHRQNHGRRPQETFRTDLSKLGRWEKWLEVSHRQAQLQVSRNVE